MNRKIAILHYLRSVRYEDGGVVRAVLDHCHVLAAQSHNIVLATVTPTDVPTEWFYPGQDKPRVLDLSGQLKLGWFFKSSTQRLLQKEILKADIVYLHEIWRSEILQLARMSWRNRRPYILPTHGVLNNWGMDQKSLKKKLYLHSFGAQVLRKARFVQCVDNQEYLQAKRWLYGGTWAIMPYMINTEPFFPKQDRLDPITNSIEAVKLDKKTFLFLSRIHPKKGLELLIDAAAVLANSGHEFSVIVAGSGDRGYLKTLHSRVKRKKVESYVSFVGPVVDEAKFTLYRSVHALVLPSYNENFGLVLTEAMGCGLPVITTRNVDIWRSLQDGGAMIIEADVNQLTSAMTKFLNMSESDWISISEKSRRWLLDHFGTRKLVSGYRKLHEEALRSGRNETVTNFFGE